MTWLTPSQLDLEHWRWLRMKPQRGGWVQSLWIVLQEQWRQAVTCTRCNGEKRVPSFAGSMDCPVCQPRYPLCPVCLSRHGGQRCEPEGVAG
jgi:hypothetical protein